MNDPLQAALALHRAGRLAEAAPLYEAALAASPDATDALQMLGLLRHQQGAHDEAARLIDAALAAGAAGPVPRSNRAAVALAQGDAATAMRHARDALASQPGHAGALANLGLAAEQSGDLALAESSLAAALAARPGDARTLRALAEVRERRHGDAAALPLREALARAAPDDVDAAFAFGRALYAASRPAAAIAVLSQIEAVPHAPRDTRLLLAAALLDLGEVARSVATSRALLAAHPDYAQARSNLLIAMQHDPAIDAAALRDAHRDWAARHGAPGPIATPDRETPGDDGASPHDAALARASAPADASSRDAAWPAVVAASSRAHPLRVAFVSPRLHQGPVATFLLPLLRARDPAVFSAHLYATHPHADAQTDALRAAADGYADVTALDDATLARRFAADRIDVAIDLAGHAPGNRLTAFARRLAPLQVSWLDYFCTTGLAAMDAFFSDATLSPPRDDASFTERVYRLARGRLAYAPPDGAPDVAPRAPGPIRFCGFNRVAKLNDEVARAWCAILRAVPDGTLTLQAGAFADEAARRFVLERRFAAHGIAPARVVLRGFATHAQTMQHYGEADIALDPYPFAGCATTADALWMGVPVVTRRGDTLVSRQSASLLHAVGLDALVADDWDGYVARAVALAGDATALATMRASLRERARAGFADAAAFARAFESTLREAWTRRG